MSRKKKQEIETVANEAVVIKGSHSTITKYPNGRTEIVTDWTALQEDIRQAIDTWENSQITKPVNTRRTRKK